MAHIAVLTAKQKEYSARCFQLLEFFDVGYFMHDRILTNEKAIVSYYFIVGIHLLVMSYARC
jgi:hypothetical protein